MMAVVYSGSRFADWKLSDNGQLISDFRTTGINSYLNDEKSIGQLLNKNNTLINNAEKIKRIYFFGAGAYSKERKAVIENAFTKFFRNGKVVVEHDLTAAAIATCGDNPGIVAIVGSGSNAAYFDGKKIKENNFGLGYILGDEGSANWIGRMLLKDFLNGDLPLQVEHILVQKYSLDRKYILDKVYRQPQPALYLSSFADFILEHKDNEHVCKLVLKGFHQFFVKYIIPLTEKHPDVPVNFTGTIAAGFEYGLKITAEQHNLSINSVIKEPIYNVLKYYSNKN